MESYPSRIIRITLFGLQDPIRVKTEQFQGVMPAHKDLLDDRRLAAVLSYVRRSWGNDASVVTPDEVAKIRGTYSTRNTAWTEAELGRP